MKTKFLAFVEEATDPSNFQVAKISELSAMVCVLKCAAKKLQSKISRVEELTEMHDYWMIRSDNILIPSVYELKSVTNAMKAYRAKVVTPKKN